jgi:hypothetical protein
MSPIQQNKNGILPQMLRPTWHIQDTANGPLINRIFAGSIMSHSPTKHIEGVIARWI